MEKINDKIISWATNLEENTLEQIENASKLPMLFKHIAVQADSHLGWGICIGGVVALKNCIIPNYVGKDISCSCSAVRFNVKAELLEKQDLREAIEEFKKVIPTGFSHHTTKQLPWKELKKTPEGTYLLGSSIWKSLGVEKSEVNDYIDNQLGTLGGGNHFIEIQEDEEGWLWVMIHSGSRNIGSKICDYYNKVAENLHKGWYIEHPKDSAWLKADSNVGQDYLEAMNFASDFAKENHRRMLELCKGIMCDIFTKKGIKYEQETWWDESIYINHNFVALENHMGANVWVHRKGAIHARAGRLGIIPGSMGTRSYIVKGKGNPLSFNSCSHGAGRVMGRNQATQTIEKKDAYDSMQGIVFDGFKNSKGDDDFGEAPGAYKDIDEVMENQKDLVEIVHTLKPLAVLKDNSSRRRRKKKDEGDK